MTDPNTLTRRQRGSREAVARIRELTGADVSWYLGSVDEFQTGVARHEAHGFVVTLGTKATEKSSALLDGRTGIRMISTPSRRPKEV